MNGPRGHGNPTAHSRAAAAATTMRAVIERGAEPTTCALPRRGWRGALPAALLAVVLAGCQSPGAELSGLAQLPPLDYAVLVTGGAFLQRASLTGGGTFAAPRADAAAGSGAEGADSEPLAMNEVLDVLRAGTVFRRVDVDVDLQHRRDVLAQLRGRSADRNLAGFLEDARARGFDLLLVLEQLQDGPIDAHGINGRWPVTLATWLLLGVGAFIPDHTFESSATLRATVRDLQTGRIVYDLLTPAGPVDLSLFERSNALGLLLSLVVPPFWVHDDSENVGRGVRQVTERRLLLSLARELKSEPTRQRLREGAVAAMALADRRLTVEAQESLVAVRLRPERGALPADVEAGFESELLHSLRRDGARFVYECALPDGLPAGTLQVLVSTLAGTVSSATFALNGAP